MNSQLRGLATETLRLAAQRGDAEAQAELGYRFCFGGADAKQDYAEAANWYRLAAEQGCADAQERLAGMYYEGCGVSQDYFQSVKWLRKAAEQGVYSAQRHLADCLLEGRGAVKDREEANKWYELVFQQDTIQADKGNPDARLNVAHSYREGLGVARDVPRAIQLYCINALQGSFFSEYALEDIYLAGQWPSSELTTAVQWFQRAAEKGHCRAQYIYGMMNKLGQGVPQDNVAALKWFQRAADHKESDRPMMPSAQAAVHEMHTLLSASASKDVEPVGCGLDDLCAALKERDIRAIEASIKRGASVNEPRTFLSSSESHRRDRCPFLIAASDRFSPGEIRGISDGYRPDVHDYWKKDDFRNDSAVNQRMLTVLFDHGAEVFPLQCHSRLSSVHVAAEADNTNALRMILKEYPDAGTYNEDDCNPTPLEVAAGRGSFQAVKTLLSSIGKNVECNSAFRAATAGGWTRTAKELVPSISEDELRKELTTLNQKTICEMLLWSTVDDQLASFQLLAKQLTLNDRLVPRQDRERLMRECFGYACRYASQEMVQAVFTESEFVNINEGRCWGSWSITVPPLIHAAQRGKFELAEFCIRMGADPFLKDAGMTPHDIASQHGFTKIVILLEQAMKGKRTGLVASIFRKLTG